jgi:zinc transporter, ZIP family
MSETQTLILGAIAGATIFIGLPLARVRSTRIGVRAGMTALATGILVFLLWDVLVHGVEPVEVALDDRDWSTFVPYVLLLVGGFAVGLMSLVYYDWWLKCRRVSPLVGPGAAAVDEFATETGHDGSAMSLSSMSPARRLALLIATGIGIHNFGEGLAIGQSSASGEVALALILIIGFALHNATEGFGIVGPLSAEPSPVSWRFLALLGLIGGGPTFLGTLIGYQWVSEALQVLFFALAGGSILYVVFELSAVCRRYRLPVLVGWMTLLGIVLGFGTDFVLEAVGG